MFFRKKATVVADPPEWEKLLLAGESIESIDAKRLLSMYRSTSITSSIFLTIQDEVLYRIRNGARS